MKTMLTSMTYSSVSLQNHSWKRSKIGLTSRYVINDDFSFP